MINTWRKLSFNKKLILIGLFIWIVSTFAKINSWSLKPIIDRYFELSATLFNWWEPEFLPVASTMTGMTALSLMMPAIFIVMIVAWGISLYIIHHHPHVSEPTPPTETKEAENETT